MNGRQAWEYHLKMMEEEKESKKAKEIHDTIAEIAKEENWPDILEDHRMHSYAFNAGLIDCSELSLVRRYCE